MSHVVWTRERPAQAGFYWAILLAHETDEARDDIHWMAKGLRPTRRPLPTIAEVCEDDDEPGGLVPFFVGMEDYPFEALAHDFGAVWWPGDRFPCRRTYPDCPRFARQGTGGSIRSRSRTGGPDPRAEDTASKFSYRSDEYPGVRDAASPPPRPTWLRDGPHPAAL